MIRLSLREVLACLFESAEQAINKGLQRLINRFICNRCKTEEGAEP